MDDLSGKINELLSDPESMERIKNLASMLQASQGGSNSKNQNNNDEQNQSSQNNNQQPYSQQSNTNPLFDALKSFTGNNSSNNTNTQQNNSSDDFNIDPATVMKLVSAMKSMNGPDPRVDLLRALKENLSDRRQKKVDDAIKVMRLLSLMPILQEQGIFNLFN